MKLQPRDQSRNACTLTQIRGGSCDEDGDRISQAFAQECSCETANGRVSGDEEHFLPFTCAALSRAFTELLCSGAECEKVYVRLDARIVERRERPAIHLLDGFVGVRIAVLFDEPSEL